MGTKRNRLTLLACLVACCASLFSSAPNRVLAAGDDEFRWLFQFGSSCT